MQYGAVYTLALTVNLVAVLLPYPQPWQFSTACLTVCDGMLMACLSADQLFTVSLRMWPYFL